MSDVVLNKPQDKDIVNLVKTAYPKYDKYLHSKTKRPDEYGICLVSEAQELIKATYGEKPQEARRADKHRLKYKVQCRVTKTKFRRLQQCKKQQGYGTMQTFLDFIINEYLKERMNHGKGI